MASTHRAPDLRSSLVVSTHDLPRRAGSMREVTRVAEAPAGIGIDVIGVPEHSPIDLQLRLESVSEGILVSGTASVRLAGECVRCLEPLEASLEFDLQELYVYPESELDDEDASRVVDETIDLASLIRDQVVLELPFAPLCDEDCAGLCPRCGTNLNQDPEHSHDDGGDARWARLAELRLDGDAVVQDPETKE